MKSGILYALSAIVLWSTNALAGGYALAELGLVQVLALQFSGAVVGISSVMFIPGSGFYERKDIGANVGDSLRGAAVGAIGLTGTIFFQYLAFATAPIVEANVVAYGWPLFAAIWVAVVYRTRQTLVGVPLAVVGFAGVAIILFSGGGTSNALGGSSGYLAALVSAVCMAFYTVTSGRVRAPVYAMLLPSTVLGASFAFALCIAGFAGWTFSNPAAWMWSVYAGIGPMAGGFLLWGRAMSGDGAKRLAPLGYATPLVSTLVLLAFGETLTPGAFVGAALILTCSIGVFIVNAKELR